MTREEFIAGTGSIARHGLTVIAGLLAARGIAGGDQLIAFGSAGAVFLGTVGWSLIEKSSLLSMVAGAAPTSELETLAADLVSFRAKGSNPLLVAHLAQTVLALAQTELAAAHPELIPPNEPAATPVATPAAVEPVTPPATMTDGITHYPNGGPQ